MNNQNDYYHYDVLVAIIKDGRDLDIAKNKHWYRIPVDRVAHYAPHLQDMRFLALYQKNPRIFGKDAFSVNYYAEIEGITQARRIELLPNEVRHENAQDLYYKLSIAPLQRLPRPIRSKSLRRHINFIETTWEKFRNAEDMNDLYHTSPLEDEMWQALIAASIPAERQYDIRERYARNSQLAEISAAYQTRTSKHNYALDFAIECADGSWVAVECEGHQYHSEKEALDYDRRRRTSLTTDDWLPLHFGTTDIRNNLNGCIDQLRKLIDLHGGPVNRSTDYDLYRSDVDSQLNLF